MELQLDLNKEYGIVLEGGGAKGAYQVGAWKAIKEAGIRIRGVAGTSVGALNGALVCMDDFAKAERIWENISYSRVMDVDDTLMDKIKNFQLKNLPDFLAGGTKLLKERGFDVAPLKGLIDDLVDEERIRSSDRELYVVTYSPVSYTHLVYVDIVLGASVCLPGGGAPGDCYLQGEPGGG